MPTVELDLTAALKLFGDPTRLRILALLAQDELTVGDLARALDLSQSRVSNHLKHLREADLLVEHLVGGARVVEEVQQAEGSGVPSSRRAVPSSTAWSSTGIRTGWQAAPRRENRTTGRVRTNMGTPVSPEGVGIRE